MPAQATGLDRLLPLARNLSHYTLINRQNGWGHWWDYCDERGILNFPADPVHVVDFIEAMSKDYKPGTVDGYVSAISVIHKERKAPSPLLDIEVRRAKAVAYRNGPPSKQAKGMTAAVRDAMIAACSGEDLESVRDRALISVAYDALARLGEIAEMDVASTERAQGNMGGTVFIQRLKTDRQEVGRYAYLSPVSLDYIDKWKTAAKIVEGPLFRSTHHNTVGLVAIGRKSIAMALKKRARLAGLPDHLAKGISGHSGRVGAAQDMAARGDHRDAIMLAGGWKNENTVRRYTEKTDALCNGSARLARDQGRAGVNDRPKIRIAALEKMDLLLQSQIITALASLACVDRFDTPK